MHLPTRKHALYVMLGLAISAAIFFPAVFGANGPNDRSTSVSTTVQLPASRLNAPSFPPGFAWLNTDQPLALDRQLKGHVIVIDFWTYCCINCMHVLPDLEYLEHKYANEPVAVIGVHSAKFENEKDAQQIEKAIKRYRIHHPVLVDQDFRVWQEYGARGWPTFVIIDTRGKVVGVTSGEGQRDLLDGVVAQLLEEGRANGTLAKQPFHAHAATAPAAGPAMDDPGLGHLYFPGKVAADAAGNRLIIADSNHNRLVVATPDGVVRAIIGSGGRGFKDGPLAEAQFANPQGAAVDGDVIYVADTDNHAIRRVDLAAGSVTTIAGNGAQGYDRRGGRKGTQQSLSSPWDVAISGGKLYIAMAGTHQLWAHDLTSGETRVFAGSGTENIVDGPASSASLAQPSGLTVLGDYLYFADSENSAVRRAAIKDGRVETLIGTGLFDYGFREGKFSQALLQHPLGIAALGENIVIADTYNSRIRLLDLKDKTIRTLYGGKGELDEPGGLAVLDGVIYIADTNHHRIQRLKPGDSQAEEIPMKFPATIASPANR